MVDGKEVQKYGYGMMLSVLRNIFEYFEGMTISISGE